MVTLVRKDQRAVPGLEKQIVAAQQPESAGIGIVCDRVPELPFPDAVNGHLDRILGPVRLDLGDRRVQEGGHVVRLGRSEKAQIVPDRLQVLRRAERFVGRTRLASRPTRDAPQDRR